MSRYKPGLETRHYKSICAFWLLAIVSLLAGPASSASDGPIQIQSRAGGCLDIRDIQNGVVVTASCGNQNSNRYQFWNLHNGQLQNHAVKDRCLDVRENKDGGKVVLASCRTSGDILFQHWSLEDGKIKNAKSGKCLMNSVTIYNCNAYGQQSLLPLLAWQTSTQLQQAEAKESVYLRKTWMSRIPAEVKLSEINIPGTHDSGADYGAEGDFLNSYSSFIKTQDMTISEQLNAGIRYLDIRLASHENGALAIHHGPWYQQLMFGEVLKDVVDFLKASPGEAVIMRIQEEHLKAMDFGGNFNDLLQTYFNRYDHGLFYKDNRVPTMGEIRKHIVLTSIHSELPGIDLPFGPNKFIDGANYQFNNIYQFQGGDAKARKWDNVLTYLNQATLSTRDKIFLNSLSASPFTGAHSFALQAAAVPGYRIANPSGFPTIFEFAEYVNSRTLQTIKPGNRYGILSMDYPPSELISKIILSNKLTAGAAAVNTAGISTSGLVKLLNGSGNYLSDNVSDYASMSGKAVGYKLMPISGSVTLQDGMIVEIKVGDKWLYETVKGNAGFASNDPANKTEEWKIVKIDSASSAIDKVIRKGDTVKIYNQYYTSNFLVDYGTGYAAAGDYPDKQSLWSIE